MYRRSFTAPVKVERKTDRGARLIIKHLSFLAMQSIFTNEPGPKDWFFKPTVPNLSRGGDFFKEGSPVIPFSDRELYGRPWPS